MEDQLILKNHLKEARAEKKLSQTQLSELVGVSRNTISSIETGQFNPTAKLALILCTVSYTHLIDDAGLGEDQNVYSKDVTDLSLIHI